MTIDEPPGDDKPRVGDGEGRIEHEWDESLPPSTAIVEAAAAATGREPTDMPELYEYIDGDALDKLVTRKGAAAERSVELSFGYGDVDVWLDSNGQILVELPSV